MIPMPALTESDLQRFWSRVAKRGPDECWPWIGFKDDEGYGKLSFRRGGRAAPCFSFRASRLSYFLATGIDPGELLILHKCDYKSCCNPAHLYAGTVKENSRDAKERGQLAGRQAGRGENHRCAKLTEADIIEIRKLAMYGLPNTVIAKQFGVEPPTISVIVSRKTWRHV